MTTELVVKKFESIEVFFMEDGWFNATKVAVEHGKDISEWLRSDDAFRYGKALANSLNLLNHGPSPVNEMLHKLESCVDNKERRDLILPFLKMVGLVRTQRGSPKNGGGTWIHPKLGVKIARWFSVDFELWCDQQIETIIRRLNYHQQRPQFQVELHPILHFPVVSRREDLKMKRTRNTYTSVLDVLGFASSHYKRCLTNNVSRILIGMPIKPFRRLHGIPAGSQRRTRLYYDSDLRITMNEIEDIACQRLLQERLTDFELIEKVVYDIARTVKDYVNVTGVDLTEHVPNQLLIEESI